MPLFIKHATLITLSFVIVPLRMPASDSTCLSNAFSNAGGYVKVCLYVSIVWQLNVLKSIQRFIFCDNVCHCHWHMSRGNAGSWNEGSKCGTSKVTVMVYAQIQAKIFIKIQAYIRLLRGAFKTLSNFKTSVQFG